MDGIRSQIHLHVCAIIYAKEIIWVLGMPRPCEHEKGHQPAVGDKYKRKCANAHAGHQPAVDDKSWCSRERSRRICIIYNDDQCALFKYKLDKYLYKSDVLGWGALCVSA